MQVNVSEVIAVTWRVVTARFGGLAGMWLTFFAIQLLFSMVAFAAFGSSLAMAGLAGNPDAMGDLGASMIGFMVLFYIAYLYIAAAQSAAMNRLASPLVPSAFGDAFTMGFSSGLTLLGVFVLLIIGYLFAALIFGLVAAALSLLGPAGAAIAIIAVVAAVIYLACRLFVLAAVVAVDGVRNPVTAIVRSWQMTGGNVVGIFLSLLAFLAIAALLLGVPLALVFGAASSAEADGVAPAVGTMLGLFAVLGVVSVVLAVIGSALQAVIHSQVSDVTTGELGATFE